MSEDDFLEALLEDPDDAGLLQVFADWLAERDREELAAIVRQADGFGAWCVPNRGWFAGLSFPREPATDVRNCAAYETLMERLAERARQRSESV
jgi:uncharacterized protein (TIGR02996 family)